MLHGPDGDPSLWHHGKRRFGSWKAAIEVAGLDYSRVTLLTPNSYATKREIIAEIRRRNRRGSPLTVSEVRLGEHEDRKLLSV